MVRKGERVSWQKAIREHGDTGCLFMAKAGLVQMSDHGGSGTGCFFFFLKEKLAPLQDLKHSTLCSKYSTGYFKKPHLVVAPTALPQEDSVVPNVRRECRQPNKQRA